MKIIVHIAEYKIAHNSGILLTNGLGSCVAIALYDGRQKLGGLLHFLLPDSSLSVDVSNPAKFADMGTDQLVYDMLESGANIKNIRAKIVGGANMFSQIRRANYVPIGTRNIEAAKTNLERHGIPIIAEDTGKDFGRSVEFHLDSGILIVKSFKMGVIEL